MENQESGVSRDWKRELAIFAFLLLAFFAVFRIANAINIGYFITEDHLIIRTYDQLNSGSFDEVFENSLKKDMDINKRFRPLWVLSTLSTVAIFGVGLLEINLYTILLCIFTAFLLYKSCRNIGINVFLSILFSLVTLIGPATVMYIRRVDAEIHGMLLLSLSFYFMTKVLIADKRYALFKVLFVLFLILSAMMKESFLLVIPSMVFLYILLYSDKQSLSLFSSFKKNFVVVFILLSYFLIHILMLVSFVGMDKHNYAGVEVTKFSFKTVGDFVNTALSSGIFLLVIVSLGLLLDHEHLRVNSNKQDLTRFRARILGILTFLLLFVVPQLFLYYRVGFENRYYLPYLMGYSFALIVLSDTILKSKIIPKISKYVFTILLVALVFIQYLNDAYPALTFQAKRCKALTSAADEIMKSQKNDLLIVFDPLTNLWDVPSLGLYLKHFGSEKDLRYDLVYTNQTNKLLNDPKYRDDISKKSNAFIEKNRFQIIDSLEKVPTINEVLIIGNLNEKFLEKSKKWFDERMYEKKKFDSYIVYSKRD